MKISHGVCRKAQENKIGIADLPNLTWINSNLRRTKRFALEIIYFAATLPRAKTGSIIEYHLAKAGTSVGANHREANRAESRADFVHKIAIVRKRVF